MNSAIFNDATSANNSFSPRIFSAHVRSWLGFTALSAALKHHLANEPPPRASAATVQRAHFNPIKWINKFYDRQLIRESGRVKN